jgi:uncharacterized protein YxeA
MENNNGGKKLIAIVVMVILIVVALTIWLSVKSPSANNNITSPEELTFSSAQKTNQAAVLEIPDQFPGSVVYVARVELPAGGFVVVRKLVDNQAADIIGSAFFDQNSRIGNVDLIEPLIDGQFYAVQAYTDNGDAQFDVTTDKPVIRADGTILEVRFKATKDLPEKKG